MRVQVAVGAVLSVGILALALQPWLDIEFGLLEADALATHVWHRRFRGDCSPRVERVLVFPVLKLG